MCPGGVFSNNYYPNPGCFFKKKRKKNCAAPNVHIPKIIIRGEAAEGKIRLRPILISGGFSYNPRIPSKEIFSACIKCPKKVQTCEKFTFTWFLPYICHYIGAAGAENFFGLFFGLWTSGPRLFFKKKKTAGLLKKHPAPARLVFTDPGGGWGTQNVGLSACPPRHYPPPRGGRH